MNYRFEEPYNEAPYNDLLKIYSTSFADNFSLPALTDYVTGKTISYGDMARRIARLHLFFELAGIRQGDKIALLGRNTPNWVIAFMATVTYGAVIVPVLNDFSPADAQNIINHSDAVMLFAADGLFKFLNFDELPALRAVVSLDSRTVVAERQPVATNGNKAPLSHKSIVASLTRRFRKRYPDGFRAYHISYPELPGDSTAIINYTSGTTGFSKGVMLSLDNLRGNVVFGIRSNLHYQGSRALSFLPLAHAYGCAFDFLAPLAVGGHITLLGRIPSPKILIEAMSVVRPTIICCVPMILEKVYRKQVLPLLEKGPMSLAVKIPLVNAAIYSVIRKKLMDAFGGNVSIFIVGGAPMNQETEAFLMKIRFPITIGYGMTECAPLISFAPDNEFKAGSCGTYLKNLLEVKIESPDPERTAGEILVRGEHVMQGYYKNEADTQKVLDAEGWLHTGDMGTMDPDGTLYIRGRSKTMILSGSGQNIYPEEIEDKLNNMYMVLESLVIDVGGGRLRALVVPDYEQAENEGVDKNDLPGIMQNNLEELNAQLAAYERVAEIVLYPTEFEKTPKRSIKRYLYTTSVRGK